MKKYDLSKYYVFIFIFLMYFIPKYFEYTTFVKINGVIQIINVLKLVSYALAIIWWSINILGKKKIPVYYYILILFLLVYFTYEAFIKDRNNVFIVLLFSLIFEEKYMRRYVNDILKISVFLYVLTIVACFCGVIENVYRDREKFGTTWTAGGLGFEYSGQLAMMLIPIVFLYYYKRSDKIKWYENVLWLCINGIIFIQARTIMAFGLVVLFIITFNWQKLCRRKRKRTILEKSYIKWCPYIFAHLTGGMLLAYRDGNVIGKKFDLILNGRLSLGVAMIKKYGVALYGTTFVNSTKPAYEILDSEYVHMLVGEGILYFLIALVICQLIMEASIKRQDAYLTLIWMMMLFNAMFNNGIFNLVMNPFGIILSVSIKDIFRKKHFGKYEEVNQVLL